MANDRIEKTELIKRVTRETGQDEALVTQSKF